MVSGCLGSKTVYRGRSKDGNSDKLNLRWGYFCSNAYETLMKSGFLKRANF